MTVHQCPYCELRFATRAEVSDHAVTDHDCSPEEFDRLAYGGPRAHKPLYPGDAATGRGEASG